MKISNKLLRKTILLSSYLFLGATTGGGCIEDIFDVVCVFGPEQTIYAQYGYTHDNAVSPIYIAKRGFILKEIEFCNIIAIDTVDGEPDLNDITYLGVENVGNIIVGENGTIYRYISLSIGGTLIPNPAGTQDLNAIDQDLPSANQIAVGDSGTVIKSTDNGLSWSVVSFPDLTNLYTCEIRGDYILVGGTSPFIYQSEDCGETWEMIGVGYNSNSAGVEYNSNSNGPPSFNAIFFVDANVGYIGGDFGSMAKTTDGGNNWNPLFAPGFETINDLFFISPDSGVTVGTNGIVRFTTDGGITWEEDTEVTNLIGGMSITQIDAVNGVYGRVIGDSLNIFFSTDSSVIPVELTSFTASVNGNTVTLNWITATELNNSGFEIERTSPFSPPYEGGDAGGRDGWEKIGFIEGHGTTTERNTYSYVDANLIGGQYLYRLKQIDFNGEYEYSGVVEVELVLEDYALFQNYPNPFNPETVIRFNIPTGNTEFVSLIIYDLLGNEVKRLVYEERSQGIYKVVWDGRNDSGTRVGSGVYLYGLETKSFRQYNKMVMLK